MKHLKNFSRKEDWLFSSPESNEHVLVWVCMHSADYVWHMIYSRSLNIKKFSFFSDTQTYSLKQKGPQAKTGTETSSLRYKENMQPHI